MTPKPSVRFVLWVFTSALLWPATFARPVARAQRADAPGRSAAAAALPDTGSSPLGPTAHDGPSAEPQRLLADAVRQLESLQAVSAQVRHEANLFGKHLFGGGSYLEQNEGSGRLMRLELTMQLGDQTSSLVQVCDGRYLWTRRNLLGMVELKRIDVTRANRALQQAQRIPRPGDMGMLPGLGGLSRLLRGLHAAFRFTSAEPTRRGEEQRPVWRLRGEWRPEQLLRILPEHKTAMEDGNPPDLGRLPAHLPDHVLLLLGKEDLFPYRIEYRRGPDGDIGESGQPTGRLLVVMDLFHVVLNRPHARSRFVFRYQPGNLEFSDETDQFLESLENEP